MIQAERLDGPSLVRDPARLAGVAKRFLDGQVAVYPTETIYGIGGRADSPDVRRRVALAKGRAADKEMLLVAADIRAFDGLGLEFTAAARRLAERFWPGPLTLVVPGADGAPVGVRLSSHPFLRALAGHFALPLISTSANLSGRPYDGAPGRIHSLLAQLVDFMVDYGELPPSPPSTVVRLGEGPIVEIVREGVLSLAAIQAAMAGRGTEVRGSEGAAEQT